MRKRSKEIEREKEGIDMMKMEYKLLGFDLDGTILTGEKKLTARTKRALERQLHKG